jgi:alanine racemase
VKADAYGHGALEIAKASMDAGAYCLGIATVTEGIELRKGGINAPILLFSQAHPDEIPDIINAQLTPFISDPEFAVLLNKQAAALKAVVPIHIKLDTGMGRSGCPDKEALPLARHVSSCSRLRLTGIATHLAVADSTDFTNVDYTKTQLSRFKKAIDRIRNAGIKPGIVHAANSGAITFHPESWLDMVRPGILLYGYKSAEEYELPLEYMKKLSKFKRLQVEPVMELRTNVVLIKNIKKGDTVSYGRTWTAPQDTFIAILPAGYADGIPRLASNRWRIIIGGNIYPLVGRISMDQCCVDLGPEPTVQRWDEATIFGPDISTQSGEELIRRSAAELAKVVGTIPYEITCNINKRVPRIYV